MSATANDGVSTDGRIGALVAGRYRIERLIGRGGMSTVYEAADQNIPRNVALKVFRPELTDDDGMRRHEGEVGLLATLNHPGLVTLFDAVADDDGSAVLVLELVTGGDMRTSMDAGPMPSEEVAVIGSAVADALAYSHERGIVHRDVKPGNILVPERASAETGARAKLADFGIARLIDETRMTATGSVLGTAHYLSPEQAVGGAVGPASDVYSLGLVLLEALTGERAFPGSGVESAAARLARDPLLPPRLDADWAALLRGMTAREPDARLDARASADRLRAVAGVPALPAASEEVLDATLLLPASTPAGQAAPTALPPPPPPAHPIPGDERPAPGAAARLAPPAAAGPAVATPGADTTATVVMTPADRQDGAPGRTPEPAAGRRRSRAAEFVRRRPVAAAAIVGALLIVLAGGIAVSGPLADSIAQSDAETPPEYPAVDGPLGEHLEQLQRSVEP